MPTWGSIQANAENLLWYAAISTAVVAPFYAWIMRGRSDSQRLGVFFVVFVPLAFIAALMLAGEGGLGPMSFLFFIAIPLTIGWAIIGCLDLIGNRLRAWRPN